MSEKLLLQWNEFQENASTAFGSLRDDPDFADVTLVCEDGQQVEAHKVILAASSPFFQNMLRRNKHPHPLIYMRGVKSDDLGAIVDFLYFGQVNIFEGSVDAFMAIANDLQIKGMTGNMDEEHVTENASKARETFANKPRINKKKQVDPFQEAVKQEKIELNETNYESTQVNITNVKQLDEMVKSLMKKSENFVPNGPKSVTKANICTICGKEGKSQHIMQHIETHHLDGISIPCPHCEKIFTNRNRLSEHVRKH